LNEEVLNKKNYVFQIFNKKPEEIKHAAIVFSERLAENHIDSEIVNSFGQTGGGTVPEGKIPSYSVKVIVPGNSKTRSEFAEKMYYSLLKHKDPVLSVLKKGFIYFDMLTLSQMEAEELSEIVTKVYSQTMNTK
jgi:seryl-tRNA(Sec) selenium transferase